MSLFNWINDLIGNTYLSNYVEFYLIIMPILLTIGCVFTWNIAYAFVDLIGGKRK